MLFTQHMFNVLIYVFNEWQKSDLHKFYLWIYVQSMYNVI